MLPSRGEEDHGRTELNFTVSDHQKALGDQDRLTLSATAHKSAQKKIPLQWSS